MIEGLSKAITLYLAPLLTLVAVLLSLLAFLAPVVVFQDRVALLKVIPSTSLIKAGPDKAVDGPSIFLGVLGSCARANNAANITCTRLTFSPVYDTAVLPDGAPDLLLSAPTSTTPIFIAVALFFSILFLLTFTLISFSHKMGGWASAVSDKPMLQRLSGWLGFLGFMIGLTAFLVLRMWFGKAVQDFNRTIESQGQRGPKLIAEAGNAFTMVCVAYAFFAVPIVISLSKLNVKADLTSKELASTDQK